MTAPLAQLQQLKEFQVANSHIFSSEISLRWFYRQHRIELLQCGAVVMLAGKLLVNVPIFTTKVIEIGIAVAAKRGA